MNQKISTGFGCFFVLCCIIWGNFISQACLNVIGGVAVLGIELLVTLFILFSSYGSNRSIVYKKSKRKLIRSFTVFVIVYILYFLLYDDPLYKRTVDFLGIPVTKQIYNICVTYIFTLPLIESYRLGYYERKKLRIFLYYIILVVAVANIIVTTINPELAKTENGIVGNNLFVLGFSFAYCFALLLPCIIYNIEYTRVKRTRKLYMLLLVVIVWSVYKAAFFIAISSMIVGVILYYLFKQKNNLFVYIISIILLGSLCYWYSSNAMYNFLMNLAELTDIDFIKWRLVEIANSLNDGFDSINESNTTFRFVLYTKTWNAFLQHPIFGNFISGNYGCIFDHTLILDLLAAGGLMLFIPFVKFLMSAYQFSVVGFNNRQKKIVLISYIIYLYMALFNPIIGERMFGTLIFLIPLIIKKNEYIDNSSL